MVAKDQWRVSGLEGGPIEFWHNASGRTIQTTETIDLVVRRKGGRLVLFSDGPHTGLVELDSVLPPMRRALSAWRQLTDFASIEGRVELTSDVFKAWELAELVEEFGELPEEVELNGETWYNGRPDDVEGSDGWVSGSSRWVGRDDRPGGADLHATGRLGNRRFRYSDSTGWTSTRRADAHPVGEEFDEPEPPSTFPCPRRDDRWDNDAVHWLLDRRGGEKWKRGPLMECLRRQPKRVAKEPDRVREATAFARRHGVEQIKLFDRRRGKQMVRLRRTDPDSPEYPSYYRRGVRLPRLASTELEAMVPHIGYELEQLVDHVTLLAELQDPGSTRNARIESLLLHARNLHQFLTDDLESPRHDDDVRAVDYFNDPRSGWECLDADQVTEINKRLAHLSLRRLGGNAADLASRSETFLWSLGELTLTIVEAMERFDDDLARAHPDRAAWFADLFDRLREPVGYLRGLVPQR